jgi:hypothetical protein
MKKQSGFVIMVCAALMMVGTVAFVSSCSEDDEATTCTCIESDSGASRVVSPSSYGAANCSDLGLKLQSQARADGYNSSYSCN